MSRNTRIPANRVISGTWGEVWVNDEPWAECDGCQAKITNNKTDIAMCGVMLTDVKITSQKGTGSISLHKVYTRNRAQAQSLSEGRDMRTKIVMTLADPDAFGAERLVLYNCSFDDETLMDFQAGNPGKVTLPFTFTSWEWLDTIDP